MQAIILAADIIIYTGPIDRYFDYCYGRLQWRTISFETETLDTPNYQGNAVINYTSSEVPFTRIIEHKHFKSFGQQVYDNPKTVVSKEYSTEWTPDLEPYYPVNNASNTELYQKYRTLAEKETNVHSGGRLGTYSYLDMDKVIAKVFEDFGST